MSLEQRMKDLNLIHCAEMGNAQEVIRSLNDGANPNGTYMCSAGVRTTPLILASMHNHIDAIRILVAYGADVDMADNHGETALHHALSGEAINAAFVLINELNADCKAVNNIGSTPLHKSIFLEHFILVSTLIDKGADVNATTIYGTTPLGFCRSNSNEAIIIELLENGANPNVTVSGSSKYTPLHFAVINSHNNALISLLKHGAKIDVAGSDGKTPLDIAFDTHKIAMAAILTAYDPKLISKCHLEDPADKQLFIDSLRHAILDKNGLEDIDQNLADLFSKEFVASYQPIIAEYNRAHQIPKDHPMMKVTLSKYSAELCSKVLNDEHVLSLQSLCTRKILPELNLLLDQHNQDALDVLALLPFDQDIF